LLSRITFGIAFASLILLTIPVAATHLRAGEIQVKRINCSTLSYQITVVVYIDYVNTNVRFGGDGDHLDFGDGKIELVPDVSNYEIVDAKSGIGRASYTATHTFSDLGKFVISYTEMNRNATIINIGASVNIPFYTETEIIIESGVCNTSPVLLIPPIDRACKGISFYHNPGAEDADNDSLSYEFVVPQMGSKTPIANYSYPNDPKFYTPAGIPYNMGNEQKNGSPVLSINPSDGGIVWDAPGSPGEYIIAIKIKEWKHSTSDNTWHEVGYTIRDMQIIVEECTNRKPDLKVAAEVCVIAGESLQFIAKASDPDHDPVRIEAFSDLFGLSINKAIVKPANGELQSTQSPYDTAGVKFIWQTSCEDIRKDPYKIIFKITDQPPSDVRLVRFYTLNVKVIAPAPTYENVSVNPVSKRVTLKWKKYSCENVKSVQVWRRVSRYNFNAPECDVGMPAFLHYQLLSELSPNTSTYTDNNISIGAEYCYRIVALIGDKKVPGRTSIDTCLIPKPATAPVITNVSVTSTDVTAGTIIIRWTSPFNIDQQQYSPPYRYKVYRKLNSETDETFIPITTGSISDTSIVDTGLNTKYEMYNYRVELFVPSLTEFPVDTSSQTSSAYLTLKPLPESIGITWESHTPWSNYSQKFPYHLIYRSDTGPSGAFQLIDSVNVNNSDFHYVDNGRYNATLLVKDKYYYYKVLMRGSYGNPAIKSPLQNFTEINGGEILDVAPPCTPILSLLPTDCDQIACVGSNYFNALEWQMDDLTCGKDVTRFELFVSDSPGKKFSTLAVLESSSFNHGNLNSLAHCYKILAVDDAGNKSDTSEIVCNDNCLRFKFPNVITPGNHDNSNDVLTPYTAENSDVSNCFRFVKKVDLRIYNRWGEPVFTKSLQDDNNYIFWDGMTSSGEEASAGTYFYDATVSFESMNPSKQHQEIKGWVQVIR
jgi:hypothetical protein